MKALKPSSSRRWLLPVIALVWLFFSCVGGVPVILGIAMEGQRLNLPTLLTALAFEIPFVLIGVGLLVVGLIPVFSRLRVSPPEVTISNDALRPGDEVVVTYRQTFKGAVEVKQASARLVFRETATYRRGTDTVTVNHNVDVAHFDLPARRYEAGDTLSDRILLRIPDNAMHTFVADHNRLEWLLCVEVQVAGWPDFKEEYALNVIAQRRG